MHPIYSIPMFITSAGAVGFGFFVYCQRSDQKLNGLFALLSLSVALWSFGNGVMYCTKDPIRGIWFSRLGFAGVVFIPTLFYHFMLEFLHLEQKIFLRTIYAVSFCFLLLTRTTWFVNGTYSYFWGFYPRAGRSYGLFIIFFYGIFLLSLYNLIKTYQVLKQNPQTGTQLHRVKIVSLAYFVATLSISDYIPNYGIEIYPFAYLAALGWLGLMAYGVFRYRLMDIQVVIRKTALYSLVSAILIAIYVGIISVLTKVFEGYFLHASILSSAVAAGVIALLFHPLQSHLQHWLDRRFPRESLDQSLLREATSDFVHEIKRPLANISMPAQLALMELDQIGGNKEATLKVRQRLEYILQESIEAGDTIEAIRALSSRSPAKREPVDLEKLFRQTLKREQFRIKEGKIQVELNPANPTPIINGDARQLEIALANILKNAVDALVSMNGSKSRRLQLAIQTLPDNIVIDIEDSGPGISKANLSKLFDPWFSTKGSSGMGIGLFLAREILRLHGAYVEAQSQEGKGSRFRITFPSQI